jgi:DNA repair exonuclease SbcCD nuclease subunit
VTKVLVHTDQHYGVRNDNPVFYDHAKRCNEKFFHTIEEGNYKHVFLLGDLFERRKYVNMLTLHRCQKDFLEPLNQSGAKVYVIPGNHDCFYKDTYSPNWLWEIVRGCYQNIHVINEPAPVYIDGTEILLLPWITPDRLDASVRAMEKSTAKICMGHFEIKGFSMHRGTESHHGFDPGVFGNFELVLSGHYHTRSRSGNIVYVGAALDTTWADYNDPRGFTIVDLSTLRLDHVDNEHTLFKVVNFEEGCDYRAEDFENCYVKVINTKRESAQSCERLIEEINRRNPAQCSVIDETLTMVEGEVEHAGSLHTDQFIASYVDALETDLDKEKLNGLLRNIHNEAVALDIT